MVKNLYGRLCELATAVRGGRNARSRNPEPASLNILVDVHWQSSIIKVSFTDGRMALFGKSLPSLPPLPLTETFSGLTSTFDGRWYSSAQSESV